MKFRSTDPTRSLKWYNDLETTTNAFQEGILTSAEMALVKLKIKHYFHWNGNPSDMDELIKAGHVKWVPYPQNGSMLCPSQALQVTGGGIAHRKVCFDKIKQAGL